MEIERSQLQASLETALRRNPVVVLTGPRQSGKTTLARRLVEETSVNYFDLEDPVSLARLEEPMTALRPLKGLVVIDEVQRRPDLFPILRVLADRRDEPARFLVLGSASGELLRQSSESLAGRAEHIAVGGFSLNELSAAAESALWFRGGFPRSYLAASDADSDAWRGSFIDTLLERDLPQWGVRIPSSALRRFWTMVAHYHGQIWRSAEPARALGVGEKTVRTYLDLLSDALVVRQLQPWHVNLGKRQVKSPKVYVRDCGLLHRLLRLDTEKALLSHPKLGASWEGFVIEQVLATQPHDEAYFWSTYQGAEIDLLLRHGDATFGIECKRGDAPRMTRSLRIAMADLKLERAVVLYPGDRRYPLDERVEAVPLTALSEPAGLFG